MDVDIPPAHCLSARHSHLPDITPISILHVPRAVLAHICPSHILLYPLPVLVTGRISITPSAAPERIFVMCDLQRTSL